MVGSMRWHSPFCPSVGLLRSEGLQADNLVHILVGGVTVDLLAVREQIVFYSLEQGKVNTSLFSWILDIFHSYFEEFCCKIQLDSKLWRIFPSHWYFINCYLSVATDSSAADLPEHESKTVNICRFEALEAVSVDAVAEDLRGHVAPGADPGVGGDVEGPCVGAVPYCQTKVCYGGGPVILDEDISE